MLGNADGAVSCPVHHMVYARCHLDTQNPFEIAFVGKRESVIEGIDKLRSERRIVVNNDAVIDPNKHPDE